MYYDLTHTTDDATEDCTELANEIRCILYQGRKLFYRLLRTDSELIRTILLGMDEIKDGKRIGEYDIDLDESKFRSIIDLGANIGLFTFLYGHRYPDKSIIAVEPENSNYSVLEKNVEFLPNARAKKCAVWHRDGVLSLRDRGTGKYGYMTKEVKSTADECTIECVSIDTIIEEHHLKKPYVVKMDIEGSEKAIFEHIDSAKWINNTYAFIVECHDRIYPGITNLIDSYFEMKCFRKESLGENQIFINDDISV